MSGNLFQLSRLSPNNAACFYPFSRLKSIAYYAALVAEYTESLQSSVHLLRCDVFLEIGAESNGLISYAEYDSHEVITMS
jgi:hypothetical protein